MQKILVNIFILCLVSMLFSCQKAPTTYGEYEDIHIDHWDDVDEVITDGLFLVYYYSPFCPDCKSIQEEFTKLIYNRDDRYNIYLMISMDIDNQGDAPIQLRGVPALFIYEDKAFAEMKLGPSEVIEYMRSIS